MHTISANTGRTPLALIRPRETGTPWGRGAVELSGFIFDGSDWLGRHFPNMEAIPNRRIGLGAPYSNILLQPRWKWIGSGGWGYAGADPAPSPNIIPNSGGTLNPHPYYGCWLGGGMRDSLQLLDNNGTGELILKVVRFPDPVSYDVAKWRNILPGMASGAYDRIPGSFDLYPDAPARLVLVPTLPINPYTGTTQWWD